MSLKFIDQIGLDLSNREPNVIVGNWINHIHDLSEGVCVQVCIEYEIGSSEPFFFSKVEKSLRF